MHLGEKLKSLRKTKNWTQPQLAEAIGIEQSYLSKLENGKSIPSADIYQLILTTFEVDTQELLRDIDQSVIYRQLRQIPEVANYLTLSKQANSKSKKIWLVTSSFWVVVGLVLLLAGQTALLFPEKLYNYYSMGVVLENESKEVFNDFMRGYQDSEETIKDRTLELNRRLNERYLLSSSYKGDIFNIPVEGGSRTYRLDGFKTATQIENRYITFIGLFLLLSGIFGFILERKFYQK
jgi:transcriptional regulator with XRE-family HTH domain